MVHVWRVEIRNRAVNTWAVTTQISTEHNIIKFYVASQE